MKFTLSWLHAHLDSTASLAEIVDKLTLIGLEVEALSDPSETFANFEVAEILHGTAPRSRSVTNLHGEERRGRAKTGMRGTQCARWSCRHFGTRRRGYSGQWHGAGQGENSRR